MGDPTELAGRCHVEAVDLIGNPLRAKAHKGLP